jgi:hypothetical protein
MNELHLLEDCTLLSGVAHVSLDVRADLGARGAHLAGFTSSKEKHLDFVAGLHTVALELTLNLIVSCAKQQVRRRFRSFRVGVARRRGYGLALAS